MIQSSAAVLASELGQAGVSSHTFNYQWWRSRWDETLQVAEIPLRWLDVFVIWSLWRASHTHTHRGEPSQSHLTAGCTSCVIAAAAAPVRTWETLTQTSTHVNTTDNMRMCVCGDFTLTSSDFLPLICGGKSLDAFIKTLSQKCWHFTLSSHSTCLISISISIFINGRYNIVCHPGLQRHFAVEV